jgi:GNAT superfamily N-acetyltransferase
MIRRCDDADFEAMWAIINDGAHAYKGIIPEDRWAEPYMSKIELRHEIDDGVAFWGYEESGDLIGVMGFQQVHDVTLIRHAYVATTSQRRRIGAHLLSHLRKLTPGPILIGTWSDAVWAIRF